MARTTGHDPLKVIIVGAGIGGLTAAIGLRRQGHQVTLFERSQLAQETGAALHLAPNCHGILRRFGVFPESFGANPVNGMVEYEENGNLKLDIDLRNPNSIWQHQWVLSHRVGLHESLKAHATSPNGRGIPAVLKTSSSVVDVDCSSATIILEDGTTVSGDLVIGADGVSSVTRKAIVGEKIKPFGSGKSAFRFMLPCQKIRDNSETTNLASRDGYMTIWYGNDRRLVMYPCSNNTVMNFVAIHPSNLSATKTEDWGRGGSKETLLDVFSGFGPVVTCLLEMVDSNALKVWTLLDMNRIPSWVKGRLALLGDAAHPFLPHQGQGGGIAIEDAASLSAVLPSDTPRDEIGERLALYEKIRDERAHKIQEFTRIAGTDLDDVSRGKFNIMEFTHYNFGHDEWHNSCHALKKHLWSRSGGVRWRTPISYGPFPSPRQTHYGRGISGEHSRFITHSVRFRTSATLLKTLFPKDAFSFAFPGSVAEASFRCTELIDMDWLGGGGYKFFGLWIHGVQYEKKDGTKIPGSFLPILFENSADPIVTGREEIGMPKHYCDIIVAKENKSIRLMCGSGNTFFVNIKLHDPVEPASNEPHHGVSETQISQTKSPADPADANMLLYRYVPAVGKPGTADAEYPVAIRGELSTTPRTLDKTLIRSESTIECTEGDWESLPTLHHVAAGFAEMPIYGIVESRTDEGHGVDHLAHAERIE